MDLKTITWNLQTYPLIIILLLGFFGNAFIFYIFLRPNFRSSSITIYIQILAVTDSILLMVGIVPNVYKGINGNNLLIKSNEGCILQRFLMFFIGDISVWILIVITIDRLVAVVFPVQNAAWKSKKNTTFVLITVFMLSVLKNFPITFTLTVVNSNQTKYCGPKQTFVFYEKKIRPFISLFFYYLIPASVMTVCTILIILKMRLITKKLEILTSPKRRLSMEVNNINVNQSHYSKSLTHMSIAINILFIVLLTPSIIIWTIISLGPSLIRSDIIGLLYDITNILVFGHHSMNFYLFFMTGPRFRREVLNIIRRKYSLNLDSKNESVKTGTQQIKEYRFK